METSSGRSVSMFDKRLGQRIRVLRNEKKMSQADLGDALGLSFQQVHKYEKGVNRIAAPRLQQIADALGVPVTTFYHRADNAVQQETQSLLFADSRFSLRLLRAYNAIKDVKVRRDVVALLECVTGISGKD